MSGLEIVGALASIGQLVEIGLKLSSLFDQIHDRVKYAPERVRSHKTQVRQLLNTALFLKESGILRNENLDAHIQATLAEAEQLHTTLQNTLDDYTTGSSVRKVWKVVIGRRETQILASFDRLEKEKTSLIICIKCINSKALGSMSTELNKVHARAETTAPIIIRGQNMICPENAQNQITTRTDAQVECDSEIDDYAVAISSDTAYPPRTNIPIDGSQSSEEPVTSHILKPKSTGNSRLLVGNYKTPKNPGLETQGARSFGRRFFIGGHVHAPVEQTRTSTSTPKESRLIHNEPQSHGNSSTILGNVGPDSNVEEIKRFMGSN